MLEFISFGGELSLRWSIGGYGCKVPYGSDRQ